MLSNERVLIRIDNILRSGKSDENTVDLIKNVMSDDVAKREEQRFSIRWISVDDDLPEDGKQVLVCGFSYDGKKDVGFSSFERSSGWRLPSNFCQIYLWAEHNLNIPDFEVKEEHNLWGGCPIDGPMLKEEKLSFEERIENQREEFHQEIGKDLIGCLKRLTNG